MNIESSVTVARDLTQGGGPWGPGPLLRRTNVCRGVQEKQFLGSETFFFAVIGPLLRKFPGADLAHHMGYNKPTFI